MDLDFANDPAIDVPEKIAEITKDANTATDVPVPAEGTVGGFSPLSKINRALTSPSRHGSRAVFLIFFGLNVTAILLAVIALSIKLSRSEIKKSAQGEFSRLLPLLTPSIILSCIYLGRIVQKQRVKLMLFQSHDSVLVD